MGYKIYSRKEFINKCLAAGCILSGSALAVNGCNSKKSTATNNPCDDLSDASKSEIAKRKKVGYVKQSTVPGSHCSNCKLYLPPTAYEKCGGCVLFDGPVKPNGYCMQYESNT